MPENLRNSNVLENILGRKIGFNQRAVLDNTTLPSNFAITFFERLDAHQVTYYANRSIERIDVQSQPEDNVEKDTSAVTNSDVPQSSSHALFNSDVSDNETIEFSTFKINNGTRNNFYYLETSTEKFQKEINGYKQYTLEKSSNAKLRIEPDYVERFHDTNFNPEVASSGVVPNFVGIHHAQVAYY